MPIDDFLNVTLPPPVGAMDLGVPELPQPPQAPVAPPQKSGLMQTILQAVPGILGGALGPGAGTGLLQGTVMGQQRQQQEQQQQQRLAQDQYRIEQQAYAQQAQQHDQATRQREAILQQNLTALRSQVKDLPDKKAYDAYIEAYGQGLQGQGFRLDANWLRKAVPFVAPKADTLAWETLQKWQKLPNNAALLKDHPEQAANAMIPFDRDGDGEPELVSLKDLSVLAGAPLAMTKDGSVFSNPGTPLDVKANADGILQQLIAKATAEKKQITPELLISLQQEAIRLADEAKPKAEKGAGGLAPGQEFSISERLAKAWSDATKSQREMQRQFGLMQTGLKRFKEGDTNGGAQAVLVTFQKILDPTSVVRESEYARTAAGQSLLNRMQGYAERLAQGGAGMTAPELSAMVETARQMLADMQDYSGGQRRRISAQISKYKLDPATVFDDALLGGDEPAPPVAPPASNERTVIRDPKTGKLVFQ